MRAALLVLSCAGVLGKKVGLHEHASDKFKEQMHDKILQARAEVIETIDVDKNDQSTGPRSWHSVDKNKPESFFYKHMPIIELESAERGSLYVRGGKDCKKDTSRPHTTQPMFTQRNRDYIKAMYVKDETGTVVHLSEYNEHHEGEHPVIDFDIPSGAETLQPYALTSNAGLWQGPVYKVADLVKPFLKEEL